jgi:hypothetical protein
LYLYSKNVIKGRWKEVEKYIVRTNQIGFYLSLLKKEKDIKEFKNLINLSALNNLNTAVNFMNWKPTHKMKVKGKKIFEVMILDNNYNSSYPDFRFAGCRPGITEGAKKSKLIFQVDEWISMGKDYNNKHNINTYYIYCKKNGEDILFKGPRNRWKIEAKADITPI